MVKDVQVGIVSWSIKPCATDPFKGVFTSVTVYIDWIEEKIEIDFEELQFRVNSRRKFSRKLN